MDKLRNYIRENKEVFNAAEPSMDHLKKFQRKLGKEKKTFSMGILFKAAAIAILSVLSGLWLYEHTMMMRANDGIALGDLSPNLKEVEVHYTSLVEQKTNEINNYQFNDERQKEILMEEMERMDAIYQHLQEELKMHPNDKRIINAMIQHYQLKVEVLNNILQQLREIQDVKQPVQKNKDYESTKI